MVQFDRPLGAAADLKEIEYVSALHQTQPDAACEDGSVKDVDIKRFLRSRYGIEIGLDEVRRTVLAGLGGGDGGHENDDGDEEGETIDLAELVAVLLIPALLKAAEDERDQSKLGNDDDDDDGADRAVPRRALRPDPMLRDVLAMILGDATGSTTAPPVLTRSLLSDILRTYGEEELAGDGALLGEMLAAAGAGGGEDGADAVVLDVETFARALTADVRLYDVNNETRLSTNLDDILFTADQRECPGRVVSDGANKNRDIDDDGSNKFEDNEFEKPGGRGNPQAVKFEDLEKFWNESGGSSFEQSAKVKLVHDAPAIDFVAGRYRSKIIATLLWVGFIITYFAYFYGSPSLKAPPVCVSSGGVGGFFCHIANSVLTWTTILLNLMFLGMLYVGTGSLGNSIDAKRKWPTLIGIFFVSLYTLGFYSTRLSEEGFSVENEIAPLLAVAIGGAIVINQILLLLNRPIHNCARSERVRAFFTPGSIKAESRTKQAAARKVNTMIRNALLVHSIDDGSNPGSSFGKGVHNFSIQGESYEPVGGFLWTWTRIFNGQLFSNEGVWISARVLAGNFGQLLVSLVILWWGSFLTKQTLEAWRNGMDNKDTSVEMAAGFLLGIDLRGIVDENAIAEEVINGTKALVYEFLSFDNSDQACEATLGAINEQYGDANINTTSFCGLLRYASSKQLFDITPIMGNYLSIAKNTINSFVSTLNEDLYPQEEYMVASPMIVAVIVAFLSSLALVSLYVPSVVSATLQFRSGVIPLFRDPKSFRLHRSGMDVVTILLGSMFWSALYAAALSGIGAGIVVFVFLWQATRDAVIRLTATLIGLAITISIKMVLVMVLVRSVYAGYYRERPGRANIGSMAIECANVAFSVGTALARAAKIIVITATYIGRIDTPLLAPGVGIGPVTDMYPTIFRKDILAHDAHRHPFLEVLGTMYMMKMRYATSFGSRAGYCYRLIFTIALMPWLRKYRIMARPKLQVDEEDSEDSRARLQMVGTAVPPKPSIPKDTAVTNSMPGQMQQHSTTHGSQVGMPVQVELPLVMASNKASLEATTESSLETKALEQKLLMKEMETEQLRSEMEQIRRELEMTQEHDEGSK